MIKGYRLGARKTVRARRTVCPGMDKEGKRGVCRGGWGLKKKKKIRGNWCKLGKEARRNLRIRLR